MIGIMVPAVCLQSLPVLDLEHFKCLIFVAQSVHTCMYCLIYHSVTQPFAHRVFVGFV
jgi:hypothetical protein